MRQSIFGKRAKKKNQQKAIEGAEASAISLLSDKPENRTNDEVKENVTKGQSEANDGEGNLDQGGCGSGSGSSIAKNVWNRIKNSFRSDPEDQPDRWRR